MNQTVLGKRKTVDEMHPTPPAASPAPCRPDIETATVDDGLDNFGVAVPDLTGIDGSKFAVPEHINIQSIALLDVLSDSPRLRPKAKKSVQGGRALPPTAGATPKESEWDEW
jgi:hypothetical protein